MKNVATDRRMLAAARKRVERREAILSAAETIFCRHGYHGASISDVIDAADISRGTFYLYFDSKDALFLHLIERFIGLITEALQVVDPQKPEPERAIFENVRRVVDVVCDHADLTVVVLRESRGINTEVDGKLDRLYGFLYEMLEGALINGEKSGLTRSVNHRVVATALIGAFKESFLQQLSTARPNEQHAQDEQSKQGMPVDRAVLAQALFEFAIRGLLGSS